MPRVDTYPELIDALRAACRAACPEVLETADPKGGGIWESVQVRRVAFETMLFPAIIMELLPATPGNWGMVNTVYEQPVTLYYGDRTQTGDTRPFRSKLKLIQNEIQTNGLVSGGVTFTVLNQWGIHVYDWKEANEVLLLRNNEAMAGGLAFTVLIGDNAA